MASGSCISEEGLAYLWALLNEEFDDMSMTNAKTTQQTMTYATTTQQTTVQATKATTTTTDQATTTNDTILVSLTSQMLYEMLG